MNEAGDEEQRGEARQAEEESGAVDICRKHSPQGTGTRIMTLPQQGRVCRSAMSASDARYRVRTQPRAEEESCKDEFQSPRSTTSFKSCNEAQICPKCYREYYDDGKCDCKASDTEEEEESLHDFTEGLPACWIKETSYYLTGKRAGSTYQRYRNIENEKNVRP